MDYQLFQKIKEWRSDIARKEGVELFRILSNQTIKDITELKPKTKEELLAIKGIKEKKFEKYGVDILAIINEGKKEETHQEIREDENKEKESEKKPYSVGAYISLLNNKLRSVEARVQGEVSSLYIRGNYLFFSIFCVTYTV